MKRIKPILTLSIILLLSILCNETKTEIVYTVHHDNAKTQCKIWDMKTGNLLRIIDIPIAKPLAVTISYDRKLMAVSESGAKKITNIYTIEHNLCRKLQRFQSKIDYHVLLFSHDRDAFFWGSHGSWGFRSLTSNAFGGVNNSKTNIYNIALNHNSTIVAHTLPKGIDFFEINPGFIIGSRRIRPINLIAQSLAFNHDDTQLALATNNKKIKIVDLQTQQELLSIGIICQEEAEPKVLTFNRDSTILAVQIGEIIHFYDTKTGELAYVSSEFEQEDENERIDFLRQHAEQNMELGQKVSIQRSEYESKLIIAKSLLIQL